MVAVADLITGKIVGTKKNSPIWWHEKGHIVFSKTTEGIKVQYYFQFMIMMSIVFLSFNLFIDNIFFKIYTMIVCLSVFFFYVYEEVWCWLYAIKYKKRWIK